VTILNGIISPVNIACFSTAAIVYIIGLQIRRWREEENNLKPKLYLETTIPSYLVTPLSRDLIVAAHQQITREWWTNQKVEFDIFVSQFVFDEASAGDPSRMRELKSSMNFRNLN